MELLITGGAGFIGSHLAIHLLQIGHSLTIVDNLNSYYSKERKIAQLNRVRQVGDINFYHVDLTDEEAVKKIFQTHQFNAVVHLAAMPGVPKSIELPLIYLENNMKSTVNVLKWAGETNVKHVIFASSSSVYGNRDGVPFSEEMVNGEVASPYAATKVGGESLCHVYQSLYGFDLSILRFFTVYGPWGRPDMAIPKFIKKLLNNEEIYIYDQESARDYTYIDDIVMGIEAVINNPRKKEIYNLGYGTPIKITQLLAKLKIHFPQMKVKMLTPRQGDVKMTWSDISKAKKMLNFSPQVDISEGLDKTIIWAKEHKEYL
ncbi:UDP-glucose 4-epimerase [Vulcanibacillus modesticaldus]|uniref:UDP-glucose 4-epimerase n=1 Tax=Vulcanibacillus modesticaldus TaxID=337097 RepID=A0A1D2YS81_9BACI|nr:NAD-dependent epimerase/dehydratase family protein [Vulcanibacillus modesticaldus]OEF96911.1 UDP-glucose 4-epimerase [Vulcanibacillus modesticaldus]